MAGLISFRNVNCLDLYLDEHLYFKSSVNDLSYIGGRALGASISSRDLDGGLDIAGSNTSTQMLSY